MKSTKGVLTTSLLFPLVILIVLSSCTDREDRKNQHNIDSEQAPKETPATTKPDDTAETAITPPPVFGETHSGEATYYHATGKGNCSFDESNDLMVAAINTEDYADAALCGGFLNVVGPTGNVTVRVVDRCPGCKKGGLDLSKQAFERIAPLSSGRVPVNWQVIAGTVEGPVQYHYMEGTTRYWTAIQVRNHRWPIAHLSIKPRGIDEWLTVQRRRYNYFVYPTTIASGDIQVRLTDINGAVLDDELPEPASNLTIKGHGQF